METASGPTPYILAAAVAAKADFLLTGDTQHFGRYFRQVLCGVRVLRPAEFLKSLAEWRQGCE